MREPEYDDIIERIMSASSPREQDAPDGAPAPGFGPEREAEPAAKADSPEEGAERGPEEAEPEKTPSPQVQRRPPLFVTAALGAAALVLALALVWQVRANRELDGRYMRALNIWAAESMYYNGAVDSSATLVSSLTPGLMYNGVDCLVSEDLYAMDPETRLKWLTGALRDMGLNLEERQSSGGWDIPHGRDADVDWIAGRK